MKCCEVRELREVVAKGCELLDVREYKEYSAERVAGARWAPLGEIERLAAQLDPQRRYYVICRSGRRSAEAQRKLLAMGFKDVINVQGGMMAWKAAGYEVECDADAGWSLERQVRLVAGLMVLTGAVLGWFIDLRFIWLSAFVGLGLIHAAVTDSCAMAMLLARMPWNRSAQSGNAKVVQN